jgi:hypothetical protein
MSTAAPAKLPTMADHFEAVEIASPPDRMDSPSDYSDEEHGDIGEGAGEGIAVDTSAAAPAKPTTSTLSAAADSPTASDLVSEPAETEVAEAPAAPEFTPELLAKAKGYGFDEAAAKEFGTPRNLEWAMAERARVTAEWGQKQLAALMNQQQPPPQQVQQQQQVQQPPQQVAQQQQLQTAAQPTIQKFTFDKAAMATKGFDDDTIEFLGSVINHFNGELEKVGGQIQPIAQHQQHIAQQITGQSQAEEEARFVRDADAFFDKLDPEWHAVFGKGSAMGLSNGAELDGRRKVANAYLGLKFADAQSNQRTPDAELWQSALSATHFTKQQEIANKALADKVSRRQSQTIARAGAQRAQPLTGEEKAFARVAKFQKKHRLEGSIG